MKKYTIQEIIDQRILVEFDTTEQAKLLAEEACKLRGCENDLMEWTREQQRYIRVYPSAIGDNVSYVRVTEMAADLFTILHFNDVILPETMNEKFEQKKMGAVYDTSWLNDVPELPWLLQADALINGDRQADYGDVKENFDKITAGWQIIFANGIDNRKVAHAMIWLKICRDLNKPKKDNIVDIAGYAGLIEKL